jgi:sugar lactone lactonase YvrE
MPTIKKDCLMTTSNPLRGFTVDRSSLRYVGKDLQRPECILAERDGSLWVADSRGGVMHIAPDGTQRFVGPTVSGKFGSSTEETAEGFESKFTQGTLPNGLAFAQNGDILISNFGTDLLEVMTREGATKTLYDTIDGKPIGKVNFVLRDSKNRVWITVSTKVNPWTEAFATRVQDGFVALVDKNGLRIVADGFRFTNEIRFDAKETQTIFDWSTVRSLARAIWVDTPTVLLLTASAISGAPSSWWTNLLHSPPRAISSCCSMTVIHRPVRIC